MIVGSEKKVGIKDDHSSLGKREHKVQGCSGGGAVLRASK